MSTNETPAAVTTTKTGEVTISWSDEEKQFRAFLDDNMSGQDDVKDALVDILAAIRNPLRDPNAPIFSVLMCGPSTSGKTLGFKLLVQWVHGDREKMMFFTGSEFEERHQIQKLIGAPHGYIGFVDTHDPKYVAPKPGEPDDSALLSQHNLNNSVMGCKDDVIFILFDEWEKFHFAFNRFMLNPLREGRGKLNNGQPVNFRNCVIGFTSNLGSEEIEKMATPFGFAAREAKVITKDDVRNVVVRELVKGYPPEFRNRINRVLFFQGLTNEQLVRVVDLELKTVETRILNRGKDAFILSVDQSVKLWLLERDGSSDEKSPLPGMQQKMNLYLVTPLGRMLNNRLIHGGDIVTVTHKEGEDKLTFSIVANPLAHLGPADIVDEPEMAPKRVEPDNSQTVDSSGGSKSGSQGRQATAVILLSSGGASDDERPSASGLEVAYLQPFRLIMQVGDRSKVESIVNAVLKATNDLPNTTIVEFSVNLMKAVGTAEVLSTLEEMMQFKASFPGLRVVVVGGELGD